MLYQICVMAAAATLAIMVDLDQCDCDESWASFRSKRIHRGFDAINQK